MRFVIGFATLVLCFVPLFLGEEQLYVAGPVLACVIIMSWMFYALIKKDCGVPILDIGFICGVVTFFYTVMPLVNYWVNGLQFEDYRLSNAIAEEIGRLHWRHVVYLASFALSYVLFRSTVRIQTGGVEPPTRSVKYAIVTLCMALWLYKITLELITGYSFDISYSQDNLMERSQLVASMPLLLTQISVKLHSALVVAKFAVLFLVVQKSRVNSTWRIVLVMWLALELISCFLLKGARSQMVFLVMGAALMYHRLVAPLKLRYAIPGGLLLLLLVTFMGVYRAHFDVDSAISAIDSQGGVLGIGGEFQSILGTTWDVYQRIVVGNSPVPWYIQLNDFVSILPPQQFFAIEKTSASQWYMTLIGAPDTGQGFMWGVITQCLVGLDWPEVILRGTILGFVLAKIHEWYARRQDYIIPNIVYIYLCVRVYYTFRDTTGALLTILIWEILVFYVLYRILTLVFGATKRRALGRRPVFASSAR
jgi:hypothetical protein